jgi:nicotinamidase-related amidase
MSDDLERLTVDSTVALVVDVQEKLMPAIVGGEQVIAAAGRFVEAMGVLGVPVMVTEQYPAGLGRTCAPVSSCLGDAPVFEKVRFSGCVEPVVGRLKALGRRQVVVAGAETHVCVQQTVLDLLRLGYGVYVLADAVGSRRELDREVAFGRMRQAGAVVTTSESVIFELLGQAGGDIFKRVLQIVK